jgi:hypothetical protein
MSEQDTQYMDVGAVTEGPEVSVSVVGGLHFPLPMIAYYKAILLFYTSIISSYYVHNADNFAGRTYFNLTGGEHMDCEFFEENSLLYFQHNSRHPIARNIYASGRMGAGSEGRRPYQHTLPYGLQVLFAISSILVIAAVVYFVYGMMYPTAYAAGAATKGDFAAVEMIKVDA